MTIVKKYKGQDVPEGATHYSKQDGYFLKNERRIYAHLSRGWAAIPLNYHMGDVIKLPQTPEAYMPKVGEECEFQKCDTDGGLDWTYCYVAGETKDGACIILHDADDDLHFAFTSNCNIKFRPIKTEREKVVVWAERETEHIITSCKLLGHLYDLGALIIPEGE